MCLYPCTCVISLSVHVRLHGLVSVHITVHTEVSWYLGIRLDVCEQTHINMRLLYVCIYSTCYQIPTLC